MIATHDSISAFARKQRAEIQVEKFTNLPQNAEFALMTWIRDGTRTTLFDNPHAAVDTCACVSKMVDLGVLMLSPVGQRGLAVLALHLLEETKTRHAKTGSLERFSLSSTVTSGKREVPSCCVSRRTTKHEVLDRKSPGHSPGPAKIRPLMCVVHPASTRDC